MRKYMCKTFAKIIGNENGFILGASILVSAILILAGVLALWTSNTEVQVVRNEGLLNREFYEAEAGIVDAIENYKSGPTQWLTNDFLLAGPEDAFGIVVSNDQGGHSVANVEVRCINDNYDTDIPELSSAAKNLPRQPHIGPPPIGSGYSLKYFEVRRYGITATSSDGNTHIQVGAWKVFNKY